MKILSAFLSLLMVALTVVPCADGIYGDDCEQETHYHQESDDNDHSHGDFCSPFCACNCCHTPTTFTIVASALFQINTKALFISNQENVPVLALQSIWHPPRV